MTAIVALYGTHQGFKVLSGLLFEIFEIFFIRKHEIRKIFIKTKITTFISSKKTVKWTFVNGIIKSLNKLHRVLKRLCDNKKITPDLFTKMRILRPKWSQLYGQPKIHKPAAPICPFVSFYNTPLQTPTGLLP